MPLAPRVRLLTIQIFYSSDIEYPDALTELAPNELQIFLVWQCDPTTTRERTVFVILESFAYDREVGMHNILDPLNHPHILPIHKSYVTNRAKGGIIIFTRKKPFDFDELRPFTRLIMRQLFELRNGIWSLSWTCLS